MQDGQRRNMEVRSRAQSLANLLIALRSAAHFYPTPEGRRAWLKRILFDIRFDQIVRKYASEPVTPPSARAAVIEFCLGHIGAYVFGRRLREAFRSDGSHLTTSMIHKRARFDSRTTSGSSSVQSESTNNDTDGDVGNTNRSPQLDHFWHSIYSRFRTLTFTPGTDDDSYDARVEFARQFTMDMRTGMPGVIQQLNDVDVGNSLVEYDECIAALAAIGHLNKSMVEDDTKMDWSTQVDRNTSTTRHHNSKTKYPVYVFGSNYVWIQSDAMYTIRPNERRPPAFDDKAQIVSFTKTLLAIADTIFLPDIQACLSAAAERNKPVITSLSRNDVSLQFSFAMPDSRLYTANIFYLKGGNTCATDFRYKKRYLSNACQCENRLSHWRLSVSVAALDGSKLDKLVGNTLSEFVLSVIRAFYRTKNDRGDHFFINQFTGLAFINYMNDSIELGGMIVDGNIATSSSPAQTCDIHRWLRGHTNTKYWHSSTSRRALDLLIRFPQLLIVYRPLISDVATADNGSNIFLNYKTFDDIIAKYVLLSLDTLRTGFTDKNKTVAYRSGDNYWVFSDENIFLNCDRGGNTQRPGGVSTPVNVQLVTDQPSWLSTTDKFGPAKTTTSTEVELAHPHTSGSRAGESANRTSFFNLRRDVDDLFRRIFSAPSRLYVQVDVLSKLGFNVTDASAGVPTRTFTHTERNSTQNHCTVICSSPLVVVYALNDQPSGFKREVDSLQVLNYIHGSEESVLERFTHAADEEFTNAYEKSVVSLDDFWVGVHAVKISFTDQVLENVNFVYFTARDGNKAVSRLSNDGLTRLSRYNMESSFQLLPPPVIYTLQQMFVRFDKGRRDTLTTHLESLE